MVREDGECVNGGRCVSGGLTPDKDDVSQRNEVSQYCHQKQEGDAQPTQERDLPRKQTGK